ncbi:MAG: hypothetical protein A2265_05380 [Bacteroidetes bacterium RIFOXYA12_FULL_33_9]|nr:MAG: hypothetical protein A2265_05380 [Bacteroidetes bacterium RIFOXYA12_FULL_33_9]
MFRWHILIIFQVVSIFSFAQKNVLEGLVLDSISNEPLAFVHIIYNAKNQGASTNIDGKFSIQITDEIKNLKFSSVGYKTKIVSIADLQTHKNIVIPLSEKTLDLQEVVVLPGENPAHRIIKKVIANKDLNNPEKNVSFSYESYSKMYFTFFLDSLKDKPNLDSLQALKADTSMMRAKDFLDKQHLFMMESVNERKFKLPDKSIERVIGSRVSGMKNPMFTILNTQLQSFSIYDEFFKIFDKMYLSPVSYGSVNKYFFLIEDTMYNKENDTIFIISFRPSKGKSFDGLKGVLHINTKNYGIQNVSAEPYEKSSMHVRVQQKYEFVENQQWFPVELNTEIKFNSMQVDIGRGTTSLIGIGKTYISAIKLNPELENKSFSDVSFSINNNAYKMQDSLLEKYRVDPLTEKELYTYHIIDSIGKEEKFDTKIKLMETMMRGYIPFKIFNLDYTKFIDYNYFEGYRLGIGLETNEKLFKNLSIGGLYAYGFTDKKSKYGTHLKINLSKRYKTEIKLSYNFDADESGGVSFYDNLQLTGTELFRTYLIDDMYYFNQYKFQFQTRFLRHFSARLFAQQRDIYITDDYYPFTIAFVTDFLNPIQILETGVNLRFLYKEKFIETPSGIFSEGSKYPMLYVNLTKGLTSDYGSFDYVKVEAQLSKMFTTKFLGKTMMRLSAGYISDYLPYQLRYTSYGSYRKFPIDAEYTFGTMRLGEFISDKFVSFNFKQDFGNLLFGNKKIKQEIAIVQNIGYGWLTNQPSSTVNFKTMEKGYFETGLLLKNIIRLQFMGYGLGVYYRYGEYAFDNTLDNVAFKLTFTFAM